MVGTITLRVRFAGLASARLSAAAWVMKFAGIVAGCRVDIEVAEDDGPGTYAAEERALRRVLG